MIYVKSDTINKDHFYYATLRTTVSTQRATFPPWSSSVALCPASFLTFFQNLCPPPVQSTTCDLSVQRQHLKNHGDGNLPIPPSICMAPTPWCSQGSVFPNSICQVLYKLSASKWWLKKFCHSRENAPFLAEVSAPAWSQWEQHQARWPERMPPPTCHVLLGSTKSSEGQHVHSHFISPAPTKFWIKNLIYEEIIITINCFRERDLSSILWDAVFSQPSICSAPACPVPAADQERTLDSCWANYAYSWEPEIRMNKYWIH